MHGAVPYSIVGVREAIIRTARVSKELIHSALISAAIHRPCACTQPFGSWARVTLLHTHCALPSDDQCQKK